MLNSRSMFVITAILVTAILVVYRDAAIAAVSQATPLCIFTIASGVYLILRPTSTWTQLLGIVMVISPLWLIPTYDLIVASITEVL